jgi:putative transposase
MRIEQRETSRCTSMLCSLLGYSRQAYYTNIKAYQQTAFEGSLLLTEVARIRRDQPRLGGRKLLHKLSGFMQDHGIQIGRDAFFEFLREQGLLVNRRGRRHPKTTFSFHRFHKHPNRIIGLVVQGPNQLWVSDITYIRLSTGFAYLSLVTDAYSRKIVGFNLCERLWAKGCIAALKMAIKHNPVRADSVLHHSDRGVQYCCNDYVKLLQRSHIGISMTQSGDPRENALAERVNGILKDELLQRSYGLLELARPLVAKAISIYNNQRPHSSINMLTPAQAHLRSGTLKKHWKNYYILNKEKEAVMDG